MQYVMKSEINYAAVAPDRDSSEPLHIQLYQAMVREIRALPPNRRAVLLSERELALQLKLSRRTTHRAYEQLLEERLVRRRADKSLEVRSDARSRLAGAYPVIGVLLAMEFSKLVELQEFRVLPYLEGLIGCCSRRNISCIMLRAPDPEASEAEIETFAATHFPRLCGVIHLGGLSLASAQDPVLERLLQHTEIPQVCVSGSVPCAHVGSVYADPSAGLDEMCRTLKARGFRRAGVIGMEFLPRLFHYVAVDRCRAMLDALRRNGLECSGELLIGDGGDDEAIVRLLKSPARPEVLLCHNDQVARSVLRLARECGLSVPGDLALAGYDCRPGDPFLASIRTDPRTTAAEAVDMAMDHFENGITEKNRVKALPTLFSDGESLNPRGGSPAA